MWNSVFMIVLMLFSVIAFIIALWIILPSFFKEDEVSFEYHKKSNKKNLSQRNKK